MSKIRTEFVEYLISLGYSEKKIMNAWKNVINKFLDELAREISCRDILEKN